MAFFKTLYRNHAHFVVLTDFDKQGRDVYLHFDTGAVCTVISIESFVAEKIDKTKFTQQIKSRAKEEYFILQQEIRWKDILSVQRILKCQVHI